MGIDCTSEDAGAVLEGSYDFELSKLSEEAREWILQLQQKDTQSKLVDINITAEDWINGWKKMRESTASAPGSVTIKRHLLSRASRKITKITQWFSQRYTLR
jgi:hypothetical protein